jgi:hypothetical protein
MMYDGVMNKVWGLLIIIFGVTFFTSTMYQNIEKVEPEVTVAPTQTPVQDSTVIQFSGPGFEYAATPLFNYTISGLIVSRQDYKNWYSLSRTDEVFPTDLCLIWGESTQNGAFKQSGTSFSQDGRWCYWRWSGDGLAIKADEVSNNHLLFKDANLEKKLKSINRGDQIQIRGKLVNLVAKSTGKREQYEASQYTWATSTSRLDTGAGACEIILVEEIKVLKQNNLLSRYLHLGSGWIMVGLLIWATFSLRKGPGLTGGVQVVR